MALEQEIVDCDCSANVLEHAAFVVHAAVVFCGGDDTASERADEVLGVAAVGHAHCWRPREAEAVYICPRLFSVLVQRVHRLLCARQQLRIVGLRDTNLIRRPHRSKIADRILAVAPRPASSL